MNRRRLPAEWEPHSATWVAWPWRPEDWPEGLDEIRRDTSFFVRSLVEQGGEQVRLLLPQSPDRCGAGEIATLAGVHPHVTTYADVWLRDTSPLFLDDGTAACFRFNGWGGRYLFKEDVDLNRRIADISRSAVLESSLVFEGGAVESDGEGLLLAARPCLCNPNRNPGLTERDVEAELERTLGVSRVVWLDGELAGDHTDGHVDIYARVVGPARVACTVAEGPDAELLSGVRRELARTRDCAGRSLEVVDLPVPAPVLNAHGERMPASYANFCLANTAVLVPTYGVATDDAGLRAVASCFPDRTAVAVPARELLTGGGALHCASMQQPEPGTIPGDDR
jgi:agmatine deiminase